MDSSRATGEQQTEQGRAIELVWNDDRDATAVLWGSGTDGNVLDVGPTSGWLPAHLMAIAAASCFMTTLLRLAEGAEVPILGYVSVAKLHVPDDRDAAPTLMVTPCIVVGSPQDVVSVKALCQRARDESDVCRALQGRVQITPDLQVIPAASPRKAL